MIAVWALVAFVGVIIVWNAVLKRNIGEAMIVGTRKPPWPKLSASTALARSSGNTGGATWS